MLVSMCERACFWGGGGDGSCILCTCNVYGVWVSVCVVLLGTHLKLASLMLRTRGMHTHNPNTYTR